MADKDKIYFDHILEAIERILFYTEGLTFETFSEDVLKQDGVIRQLEIIGEAAKHLSPEFKGEVDLPWRDIMGMRDIAIHEYFNVDLATVWDTAMHDIPVMKEKLKPLQLES